MSDPWPSEFSTVISCVICTTDTCKNLLRDDAENIPQPGFIGGNYNQKRVMLVGQNPAITKSQQALEADKPYTKALRRLRDDPSEESLASFLKIARGFMPSWRVHQDYFPLHECRVSLDDLAYLNVVRCRTERFNHKKQKMEDTRPNRQVAETCVTTHFTRWVKLLEPRVIIFLGKCAWDCGQAIASEMKIPADYLDRERSRPSQLRIADRERVAALVQKHVG